LKGGFLKLIVSLNWAFASFLVRDEPVKLEPLKASIREKSSGLGTVFEVVFEPFWVTPYTNGADVTIYASTNTRSLFDSSVTISRNLSLTSYADKAGGEAKQ
jgi:hypothetical protein